MRVAALLCLCALTSGADAFIVRPMLGCGQPASMVSLRPTRAVGRHGERVLKRALAPRMGTDASSPEKPIVVVAGATGRVGRRVVTNLLNPPVNSTQVPVRVRALVRDVKKAEDAWGTCWGDALEVRQTDLLSATALSAACEDAAAAVWCATGFSDSQDASLVSKLLGAFKLKFTPQESVDIAAMKTMSGKFKGRASPLGGPSIVMCSSAGVTRPAWPDEKKKRYPGAADIPIVRLNPLGILDVKRQGEEALREGGASYVVVRPCGLNDAHPSGRPLLSQGDIAVGRINRADVADLLTRMLFEPEAAGTTFETIALPGYPVPRGFGQQLARLCRDGDVDKTAPDAAQAVLDAQYALMQQLVPGETLQPNQVLICPTARATPSAFRMRVAAVLCTASVFLRCPWRLVPTWPLPLCAAEVYFSGVMALTCAGICSSPWARRMSSWTGEKRAGWVRGVLNSRRLFAQRALSSRASCQQVGCGCCPQGMGKECGSGLTQVFLAGSVGVHIFLYVELPAAGAKNWNTARQSTVHEHRRGCCRHGSPEQHSRTSPGPRHSSDGRQTSVVPAMLHQGADVEHAGHDSRKLSATHHRLPASAHRAWSLATSA